MAAPGTAFDGPLVSGPRRYPNNAGAPANAGLAILTQTAVLTQNGANAVTQRFNVPKHSQIIDVLSDTLVAWNSATSDTFTLGTAAAGTQYAGAVDTKSAGRVRPTFSAAQLLAMSDVGATEDVYATITPVGAASAGSTRVTLVYAQKLNWDEN